MIAPVNDGRPEPKRPQGLSWSQQDQVRYTPNPGLVYDHFSGIRAISSVDFIAPPEGKGLEFHLSVSFMGGRANREHVRQALADFGMEKAVEDNHFAGTARHFWLPVSPAEAPGCFCFETEEPIDEGGDFVWRKEPERK